MLEGNKRAIYPILKWIFENVDQLKERIYIGLGNFSLLNNLFLQIIQNNNLSRRHLTRVEVPLEEQTPEVIRLMQEVELKMEEFKVGNDIMEKNI